VRRIRHIGDPVHEAQGEQHGRVIADVDALIALLDLVERHAADRGALGENGGSNPPPPPGVADVLAQLSQCPKDGDRERG
jgi:hypothetical protein